MRIKTILYIALAICGFQLQAKSAAELNKELVVGITQEFETLHPMRVDNSKISPNQIFL